MRVNFEVDTHLVSEICQDNKKRVNIVYSVLLRPPAHWMRLARYVVCRDSYDKNNVCEFKR